MTQTASSTNRFPPQIKYIIGNEGGERFSFYGMKNILTFFLINYMLIHEHVAKANYHLFVSACYFFPLLGGFLSDRFLGKYRTILWLSLVYCAGHACLAIFERSPSGFYAGLALIALGSGGIKPCVSAHVGDQFSEENKHLVKHVFALFYWIINFGSFFASALIPKTLEWFGPRVAFGIPGALMLIATVVFWMGRDQYVHVPPTGKNPHSFLRVLWDAVRGGRGAAEGGHFLDAARGRHPEGAVEGAKAVLRVMAIFAPIPVFWALFDQKGSTWIVQATRMDLDVLGHKLAPSQLMALNPLMVMLIIPFNTMILYPALERRGVRLTALGRMTAGMTIAGLSFVAVAAIELAMGSGDRLSVLWQAGPYLLITLAEVLVSTTGLEFAYSQAPREMKSTIMSFWNLTVTVGNLITAGVAALNVFTGAMQYLFFAALILLAALVFGLLARRYVVIDHFQPRPAGAPPVPAA
ncbi:MULTISPECIES: POT family MFS transporter [Sorangium]|uniref:MFS transporter n=1 Tax=Sorangium cellulosum TaxID=56 RepID=A0A4V0NFV9_SORCE|nr:MULTISPECIES: POT family MFS transporter [Sorangium]AUX31032.1 MFS transporter [Sorangium cellulosum]WCQ90413.1 Di-/tripeptide transporter [Sorangium sp. Soce836]